LLKIEAEQEVMGKTPYPDEVVHACIAALTPLSIRKVRPGIAVFRIDAHFLGWLGFNQRADQSFARIYPNFGVHCVPIEEALCKARNHTYRAGAVATLSYPLGVACPNVEQFVVESGEQVADEAARLALAIRTCGVSFVRGLASYQELLPRLREHVGSFGGYPERYAIGLYLTGKRQESLAFLRELIEELSATGEPVTTQNLIQLKSHLELTATSVGL
jgi:hypothetical protein